MNGFPKDPSEPCSQEASATAHFVGACLIAGLIAVTVAIGFHLFA